ncbi:MAG: condensation domain-containing protein, partial [Segetibacter sp.]
SQTNQTLLPTIEAQPFPPHIPLSFSQERLWFIDKLEGSVQYHVPFVLDLKGVVDTEALEYTLRSIVNRHEVLRTVFKEHDGQVYQYVKDKDQWQLRITDNRTDQRDVAALQQHIQQLIAAPFDLANDDVLRAHLISLSHQQNVLVITIHHIASDGWSLSIIAKELAEFYSSYKKQIEARVAPLKIQYAHYALWQRKYLEGKILDSKLEYWKQKLAGVAPLQLPTDYQRPAVQSGRGALMSFTINKSLSEKLEGLRKQQDATLFMTLLSAFKVLLYRYTGQNDICVGSAIAGRQQQEVEDLVGFFVNTLALRTEISGKNSFVDLLQHVRATTLEAYNHQEAPFEKVVEAVVKERDLSRTPLFQVMFVLQNT